jgi:hypothetical protein
MTPKKLSLPSKTLISIATCRILGRKKILNSRQLIRDLHRVPKPLKFSSPWQRHRMLI